MGTEVATAESQERGIGKPTSSELLTSIVAASRDPDVRPEKMTAMADLALKLQAHEQKQEFNKDLNAAIMEMPVITKGGRIEIKDKNSGQVIQSTPFAKFEDLDRVVKPIANRHNIAYSFDAGGDEKRLMVKIIARHANGWVEESSAMPLPLETSGSKNNVQGAGSSNTYGKRYVMCNFFAISTEGEDDDGNLGRTVAMPQERQNLIEQDAAKAADSGNYDQWYRAQSPKDRAWLVSSGKHAEYASEKALPPPKEQVEVREKQPDPEPEKTKEDAAVVERRKAWVSDYIKRCDNTSSLEDLANLQTAAQNGLKPIRENFPDLQSLIESAHTRALERIGLSQGEEGANGEGQ